MSDKVTNDTICSSCGFGKLSKHESIIDPGFGAGVRLSVVLTFCLLPLNEPKEQVIGGFYENCRIFETACKK